MIRGRRLRVNISLSDRRIRRILQPHRCGRRAKSPASRISTTFRCTSCKVVRMSLHRPARDSRAAVTLAMAIRRLVSLPPRPARRHEQPVHARSSRHRSLSIRSHRPAVRRRRLPVDIQRNIHMASRSSRFRTLRGCLHTGCRPVSDRTVRAIASLIQVLLLSRRKCLRDDRHQLLRPARRTSHLRPERRTVLYRQLPSPCRNLSPVSRLPVRVS